MNLGQQRRWADLYTPEYDELQRLGRHGRTPEQNRRYLELQKRIDSQRRERWRIESEARKVDARARALLEEQRAAEESNAAQERTGAVDGDAAGDGPSSSPAADPPIPAPETTSSDPTPSVADPPPPGDARSTPDPSSSHEEPIPPPARERPPMSAADRAALRAAIEAKALDYDRQWEAWFYNLCSAAGAAPPALVFGAHRSARDFTRWAAIEYADRHGLLERLKPELSDGQLLAVAIGGGVVTYLAPSALAVKIAIDAAAEAERTGWKPGQQQPPAAGAMKPAAEDAAVEPPPSGEEPPT